MKLSAFALGTILAAGLSATAQTPATEQTKTTKPSVKSIGTKPTIKQTNTVMVKDSLKPVVKDQKRHYCPACGRG